MMTTIAKTFDFDAAHRLDLLPPEHKCHRMHGHTYRVEFVLQGEPRQPLGMFLDYADIARAWQGIHDALDHRCLNDVMRDHPTTENLALLIYEWVAKDGEVGPFLVRVRVYESATTWAEVGQP